jgi:hypothetical protein
MDLTEIAELSLDRKCCDLRYQNCSLINGYGYEFSTRDTIYVKIELIEVQIFFLFLKLKKRLI